MPFTISAPLAQPFIVLIGPDDGSDVRNAHLNENVFVDSLSRSAGGQHLDHVQLVFSLARTGTYMVDISTPFEFSRRVQVRLKQDVGVPPVPIFSGELAIETAKISHEGEYCTLVARVEPWHFGEPILGPRQLDSDGLAVLTPGMDIVFNPLIDGRIESNMSTVLDPDLGPDPFHPHDPASLWIDPESIRTTAAQTMQGQAAVEWDLANAIFSLCWAGNSAPDLVRNPTLAELRAVITDPPEIRNVHLRRGRRLPEILDEFLPRFGYNWFLQVVKDPDDPTLDDPRYVNVIRVYQIGAGTETQLFLQRPNPASPPALDLTQTNVSNLQATWNIADLANEIVAEGSFREVEGTFELYRGWPVADDALKPDELHKTEETTTDDPFEESQFKQKPNVWRKWVLNEAGDYCNSRAGVAPIGATPFTFGRYNFPVAVAHAGLPGSGSFEVAGDQSAFALAGQELGIEGSTGNDGLYTITSSAFGGTNTTISVAEKVADSTADGTATVGGLLGVHNLVKRRRFHHCLTWGADLERRDVFVQYRDPTIAGDGDPGAWKALPVETEECVGFHVLEKECGIYFSGSKPPPFLMTNGGIEEEFGAGKARLRITATVRSDARLRARAPRSLISPNKNTIPIFVDLSDRFHSRTIQTTGIWQSTLAGETFGSDAADDSSALQTYVNSLRGIEQSARISAEVEIFGITTAYQIGNLITKVAGREISFNRNSIAQGTSLYPQITGISYSRDTQRTMLRLETFDFSAPRLKKLSLR